VSTTEFAAFYFDTEESNHETIKSDTVQWMHIQHRFVADKAYKYLTFGNFLVFSNPSYVFTHVASHNLSEYLRYVAYYYLDDVTLIELPRENSFIPNVLTPDNDGINDLLRIESETSMRLTIYNRTGELIFLAEGKIIAWNPNSDMGRTLPGVYFYLLQTETQSQPGMRAGTITVLY
jgi:gliding motility-associated-like protein